MINEKEKSRIGCLLGSFDPIHMGHLQMAVLTLNKGIVDRILFVPSKQNPWKESSTDFVHRCLMVQLAIDEIDNCLLSTIDFRTTEPHYSSNTLKLLKEEYPSDELFLIVGDDVVDSIKDWNEGEWILNNFKLIVVNRNNLSLNTKVYSYIEDTLKVSSTQIRELVKNKKQVYPLVPKLVSQYIKMYKLYE